MKLVLNEKEVLDRALKDGIIEDKPTTTIKVLAKHYFGIGQSKKQVISSICLLYTSIKKRTIFYVNECMYDELNKRIENGRDLSKEIVPSKLESYKSLVCSSSIPVSNPKGILVVDDCVTEFKANVITIDDTQSDLPVIKHEKDYPTTFEESDGYGLISPELSKKWLGEISDEDYVPSGFCIRNSFCKGMVFTFDFQKFGKEVANNFMVRDIWAVSYTHLTSLRICITGL